MKFPDLSQYSKPELRELMNQVRAAYRNKANVEALQAGAKFHVGQRVGWKRKSGYEVRGTILAINPKNIRIDTEDDGIWNVFAGYVYPVAAGGAAPKKDPKHVTLQQSIDGAVMLTKLPKSAMTAGQKAAETRRRNAMIAAEGKAEAKWEAQHS